MAQVSHQSTRGMKIKIFADGASLSEILDAHRSKRVQGFTTNPTLMKRAGVADYEAFAREVLRVVRDLPISFEVFSDDLDEMVRQARKIAAWGDNVYVKIPVTNTRGQSTAGIVSLLSEEGVRLNVTAIMSLDQVREVRDALYPGTAAIVSIFAGRIADTGRDPIPIMQEAVALLKNRPEVEVLWASPRELLNVFHAEMVGCHIITVTSDLLKKMSMVGKDLGKLSIETVKMFHDDAAAAGYTL